MESFIFDFDDTLITSDAKSHLYRNGKYIRSFTPKEFHQYKRKTNDTFILSEFEDPYFILNAKTYIMWSYLVELDKRKNIDIYILTARHEKAKKSIYNFLKSKNIKNIPLKHIYTIGDEKAKIHIPLEKRKVLEILTKQYSINNFYDDNIETINFVKNIPNLNSYLVE